MLINNCQNRGAAEEVREILLKEFPNANIKIGTTKGLCSFYAEKGGLMIGFETAK
jgi:fatty acid-binding protein DegV